MENGRHLAIHLPGVALALLVGDRSGLKGSTKHFKLGFANVPKLDRETVPCLSDYGAPKYGVKGTHEEGEPQPDFRLDRQRYGGVLD